MTIDFFFIKEYVQTILERLNIKKYKTKNISSFGLSNGLSYDIKEENLVYFGNVKESILKKFKIRNTVFIADFNWDLMLRLVKFNKVSYIPVNKFPKIRRDLSLLIDDSVSFEKIKKIAMNVNSSLLSQINLFDVYKGKKLPDGKKSYAISFVFEDNSKTLTDYQIDEIMSKLISELEKGVGAEIR
mgnify:FL=1